MKKDKTVKLALDARKLNGSCVKKRPLMPNMEDLVKQIYAELSKNDHDPIWISVINLNYAYGQMNLASETSKHCNFAMTGEKINVPISKTILRPSRHTNPFPREIRQNSGTPNTYLVRRHHNRQPRNERRTYPKIIIGID